MAISWHFHAVCANNEFGFGWYWQYRRADGSSCQSKAPFDYYYDCIEDARKRGYRGPFPAGPKFALSRFPKILGARPKRSTLLEISVQNIQHDPTPAAPADA